MNSAEEARQTQSTLHSRIAINATVLRRTVSFLNQEDAQHVFALGVSILFGDGVITKGVLRLA